MGRSKMMGAGSACSTLYDCNVNLKTCGGSKKQGLAVKVDGSMNFNHRFIKTKAIGNRRDVVFTMNQLGGVSSSSFSSSHSYATNGGVHRKEPFLCYPYCTSSGIQKTAKPLDIPQNINAVFETTGNIFSYYTFNNEVYLFTDASKLQTPNFKVGGVPLQDYLQTIFPGANIDISEISSKFLGALKEEDMNSGDLNLLSVDRVNNNRYSTPFKTGFTFGNSIAAQLYDSLLNNYPEKVNTCPTKQSILNSEDEILYTTTFVYGTLPPTTINFIIRII